MRLTTRIKRSKQMIRMVRPKELTANNLIYPIFIREDGKTFEIPSIKGQNYLSLDSAVQVCNTALDLGIPAVMTFGLLKKKNADGSVSLKNDAFHKKMFKRLDKEFGDDLVIISNVCLCDFTSDDSCVYTQNGKVLHNKTAQMLGKIAVVHAEAGADVVAPAAMADGQVSAIRSALDEEGFDDIPIMPYIKTDSCLFTPFFRTMTLSKVARKGVDSSKFRAEIINEKMFMQKVDLDIEEGADIIIVKPALPNLDHILRIKQQYPTIPIATYQVTGEYVMIKSASEAELLSEAPVLMETLNSMRRAGADMILTYYAIEAAKILKSG
jgi:porphobilinogen synthase